KNYSAEDLHALRASGIRELEELSDVSASLFAPSVQSGTEFQALLRRAGHEKEYSWQPLPPAAFDEQILSGSGPADHQTDDINFVYSGGFGGVYDIDLLFDALETVDFKWKLE